MSVLKMMYLRNRGSRATMSGSGYCSGSAFDQSRADGIGEICGCTGGAWAAARVATTPKAPARNARRSGRGGPPLSRMDGVMGFGHSVIDHTQAGRALICDSIFATFEISGWKPCCSTKRSTILENLKDLEGWAQCQPRALTLLKDSDRNTAERLARSLPMAPSHGLSSDTLRVVCLASVFPTLPCGLPAFQTSSGHAGDQTREFLDQRFVNHLACLQSDSQ